MALYIFSDAHLGGNRPETEAEKRRNILQLFAQVRRDGDRLIILGDLFDFWFEYRHLIPKDFHEILFGLHELKQAGIQIDYVSGNHDFWMDDFFTAQLGITLTRDRLETVYAGKKLLCVHGDGIAKADGGYRLLKRILRNPFNIWLYRKFPPDFAYWLAKKVSGSSREYTSRRDHEFAKDYETYAQAELTKGYDIVAIAHLHIPVFQKYEKGIYVNTGDFIHQFSYFKLTESSAELLYINKS